LRDTVPPYELVDHTADLGISLSAPDEAALFESAALAMFDILSDITRVDPAVERRIVVSGVDAEDLLVGWLGELLSLRDVTGMLFRGFRVDALSATGLEATVWGEAYDPARHVLKGELKAVTHHAALVARTDDGWKARIIFDV
jgi:SHS2 domain-containing protein